MSKYVLHSSDSLDNFKQTGGGKALNMARMSQLELPVPQWFCLNTAAYDLFVQQNTLADFLNSVAQNGNPEAAVRDRLSQTSIPQVVIDQVNRAISDLSLSDCYLAIRSSGLDEDSADNSFAGQFSSFLFQKGEKQIAKSILLCWASAFSNRAIAYRQEKGLPITDLKVGVVIQKMVNTEISGVAFTRNVINPLDEDNLLLSSTWGLCEGVVSGEIDTDEYLVARNSDCYESKIARKESSMRPGESGGTATVPNDSAIVEQSSLSEQQIKTLKQVILDIEKQLGAPQDCEWGIESGKIYLLQTRPITTLPPRSFYDKTINGDGHILWDNSNIIESYSGVTTPLTFSFASFAYRQVYIQFHEIMGVPPEVIRKEEQMYRNMLGLIRGRIFYNLVNWYKLVLLLPGASNNASFMETMMGVKQGLKPEVAKLFEFTKNPPRYSLLKKLRVNLSTLYRFIRIDHIIGEFKSGFTQVYDDAMQTNFYDKSLTELGEYYNYLEERVLKRWHAPIINDYLCMIFFGLLKKLTSKWIKFKNTDSIQNDLLCGQGDLESTEPTKMMMRMAEKVDNGDPEFREWFISTDPQTLRNDPRIKKMFADFIYRYGFRCADELKLESYDLHDDPTFAIIAVSSYIRMKSYDIKGMEKREQEIRRKAEDLVFPQMKGFRLAVYVWVLKQTRKAVTNREDLRFLRTKIFGICRQVFRAKGEKFVQLGIIDDPGDIFYFTTDEIMALIEGRMVSENHRPVIENRKLEFSKFDQTPPPPDRFLSNGVVGLFASYPQVLSSSDLLASERRISDDPNLLYGISCCPGQIEGKVQVIKKVEDAAQLNGDILVAERTDPGWVPLYPSCSGILIERGSLLSHSAVVARELGIPTIVGVDGGLLTKLKTGDTVRVDATKGEIHIVRE
ncbi:MAG: phosphoenolpyruvate synthase [Bdellovibrionales bacterium]|jgi:rifampicin phosphotransferase|nr:phosphoenolpyruvate synthase [Bdellovibrionales bacterium]MBT3526185.1 phosphoenolpyruvate synthase [Bdellovibrionales bacterium]